ncbi:MAG: hypothetical protein JRJ40_09150, partial [Deltaproteobacteria bacterium]|nr:hypothetical protein [Deltaproteobacteria bacterium]
LRARLVKDISKLDRYRWSGHSVLMGKIKHEWQDRDYVLSLFEKKEAKAKKAYRQYVIEGIAMGRRPELVGGGLVRSLGGWSEVLSMRRDGKRLLADQRILGSGDFVERILADADERLKYQLRGNRIRENMVEFIDKVCEKKGINPKELRMGSRRGCISQVRLEIAYQLVQDYGIPLAEVARQLGVSTSAISKAITRKTKE